MAHVGENARMTTPNTVVPCDSNLTVAWEQNPLYSNHALFETRTADSNLKLENQLNNAGCQERTTGANVTMRKLSRFEISQQ